MFDGERLRDVDTPESVRFANYYYYYYLFLRFDFDLIERWVMDMDI